MPTPRPAPAPAPGPGESGEWAAGSGEIPRHLLKAAALRRTSWREDLVTGLCGAILIAGLFVDGWNHINLLGDSLGPFLTPWHGLLYTGFTATALWLLTRHQIRRAWSRHAIPPGYRLGLAGIALAMTALAGDAAWHTIFGEEQGITRLISPFHLILFLGAAMLATSSYRAAWAGPSPAVGLTLKAFIPILLPLTWATSMVAFFFQYASPLVAWDRPTLNAFPFESPTWDLAAITAIASILFTNLIYTTPVLLTLKRWQPPIGTFTITYALVATLNAALTELALAGVIAAALAAGLAVDLAIHHLTPTPNNPRAHRLVAITTPLVYWPTYFIILATLYHQTWHPTLWLGAIVWSTLSSYTLALVMHPTPPPPTAWPDLDDDLAEAEAAR
jgi:hypothetical protein